ncbi:Chemotaxis protein methyltransferase CheR [Citrifermentans bremense]|uniref:protein-glutamate O-methyltransferase n=1 Tax=Citrifermentans bremense TaxID=60035 RepID=A0A7R7IYL9_9BACT|nr:Chemotaxis protein methyltransferase CheR [Citrifermentans bremense]
MTGEAVQNRDGGELGPLKELILRTCGFTFEQGRERSLAEGVAARMAERGVDSHSAYHALVARDREELNALVELLTVNETYFFREPDHLNLVAGLLLGEIMAAGEARPVKILSAGCSTGEEAYSIAMMLRERWGAESERLFTVTGVDIDSGAVAAALRGVYGRGSFRGTGAEQLQRHFDPVGQGEYRVREEIRKLVRFEVVNLLNPFYPQAMQLSDVILYRNVSIYFPQEVQRRIFSNLAGLLNGGGYLVVGATETIHHDIGVLSLVQRNALFCYRKEPLQFRFVERREARRNGPPVTRSAPGAVPRSPHSREGVRPQPGEGKQKAAWDPGETKALFDTALELACQGKADEPLELLETVLSRHPGFAKALTLKASLLVNAQHLEEAAGLCQGLVARDPLCLEGYLMLGVIARHLGDEEEGLKRFREALYLAPGCWLAQFYSAEILAGRKDLKRARSGYETALRLLEKGEFREGALFPLSFNAGQFQAICRHKLSQLKE